MESFEVTGGARLTGEVNVTGAKNSVLKVMAAALLGCTVVPGFDYADYRNSSYEKLAGKWPEQAERIRALTRS